EEKRIETSLLISSQARADKTEDLESPDGEGNNDASVQSQAQLDHESIQQAEGSKPQPTGWDEENLQDEIGGKERGRRSNEDRQRRDYDASAQLLQMIEEAHVTAGHQA